MPVELPDLTVAEEDDEGRRMVSENQFMTILGIDTTLTMILK